MDREDGNDPFDEYGYTFEFTQLEGESDSITLTCYPTRKLSMDEYIEALHDFLQKFEVDEIMRDATRSPGDLLH